MPGAASPVGSRLMSADKAALDATYTPTGARVVLEFSRRVPFPPESVVHVCYDFVGNGLLRETYGTPPYTHTKFAADGDVSYHYRLSYWIPTPRIMRFMSV
jgi:hypothetical protein